MEASGVMESPEVKRALKMMSGFWWLWLVFGVLWVVVSLVILQFNSASASTVGVIIGIMFLVAGLQEFLVAAISERWKWLWIIFGVFFIAAGIVALAHPKNTFANVADMLGFLFLLVGIFWTIESFAVRGYNELWWFDLTAGILMIIMAFWTSGQFFIDKAYTLLVFGGIWALFHGITDIMRSFEIKKIGEA